MKLAITGKGGVGKTTLTALLAHSFVESGKKVIAVDADPATNLAITLGIPNPESITPISEMHSLVEERMGTGPDGTGAFFRLNPKVSDLPEKYWIEQDGIKLLVMGTIQKGGAGCACAPNALLKALLLHLFISRDEVVIVDMEAGIEHIGRATATAVDAFVVVIEASRQSIETARKITGLAKDIGIKKCLVVGNKIRNEGQREFIKKNVDFGVLAGFLPYSEEVLFSSMEGTGEVEFSDEVIGEVEKLRFHLAEV